MKMLMIKELIIKAPRYFEINKVSRLNDTLQNWRKVTAPYDPNFRIVTDTILKNLKMNSFMPLLIRDKRRSNEALKH